MIEIEKLNWIHKLKKMRKLNSISISRNNHFLKIKVKKNIFVQNSMKVNGNLFVFFFQELFQIKIYMINQKWKLIIE